MQTRSKADSTDSGFNQAYVKRIALLLIKAWAGEHGGVYVPVTEKTPPNPFLSHVPERDITTPSGRRLTLMNPACVTCQVHERGGAQFGLRGHITSLTLLRAMGERVKELRRLFGLASPYSIEINSRMLMSWLPT